jgi:hypothetical protein
MFQSRYIVPLYGLGGFQFALTSVSPSVLPTPDGPDTDIRECESGLVCPQGEFPKNHKRRRRRLTSLSRQAWRLYNNRWWVPAIIMFFTVVSVSAAIGTMVSVLVVRFPNIPTSSQRCDRNAFELRRPAWVASRVFFRSGRISELECFVSRIALYLHALEVEKD